MAKFKKKQVVVEAVQITKEMFETKKFPEGVCVRQISWQGAYARELELKHGPLEVPFLISRAGEDRLKLWDWIVTNDVGERKVVEDLAFKELFEPAS